MDLIGDQSLKAAENVEVEQLMHGVLGMILFYVLSFVQLYLHPQPSLLVFGLFLPLCCLSTLALF